MTLRDKVLARIREERERAKVTQIAITREWPVPEYDRMLSEAERQVELAILGDEGTILAWARVFGIGEADDAK